LGKNPITKKVFNYYKIAPSRSEWLGKRYFKVDMHTEFVIQVCVTVGATKKGRGHTYGVYLIGRMTFFANYLAMAYAIPCSKAEYNKNFKEVIGYLS
jgi:hypothetical protein